MSWESEVLFFCSAGDKQTMAHMLSVQPYAVTTNPIHTPITGAPDPTSIHQNIIQPANRHRSKLLCSCCMQTPGSHQEWGCVLHCDASPCSPANLLCVTCPGFTCLPPAGLRPFAAAARSTARYCRASDVVLLLWRAAACLKKSTCAEAATTSTS